MRIVSHVNLILHVLHKIDCHNVYCFSAKETGGLRSRQFAAARALQFACSSGSGDPAAAYLWFVIAKRHRR